MTICAPGEISQLIGARSNGVAVLLRTTMPTRSASCKASAPDLTAYPVSSNSLLDRAPQDSDSAPVRAQSIPLIRPIAARSNRIWSGTASSENNSPRNAPICT